MTTNLAQGYILHESRSRVVIATGFVRPSANRKTGKMIQVWILVKSQNPLLAIASGRDYLVCGNCPHRGPATYGANSSAMDARTCYVEVGRAPMAIHAKYLRGGYPKLSAEDIPAVFAGRAVRFGAYGDPCHIPLNLLQLIATSARRWTGYTHQWRQAQYQDYRQYLMASADSIADKTQANSLGWRTFRVRSEWEQVQPNEVICPASDEGGHRTQCAKCSLCNGAGPGKSLKSIVIKVHGTGMKNFVSLQSLLSVG